MPTRKKNHSAVKHASQLLLVLLLASNYGPSLAQTDPATPVSKTAANGKSVANINLKAANIAALKAEKGVRPPTVDMSTLFIERAGSTQANQQAIAREQQKQEEYKAALALRQQVQQEQAKAQAAAIAQQQKLQQEQKAAFSAADAAAQMQHPLPDGTLAGPGTGISPTGISPTGEPYHPNMTAQQEEYQAALAAHQALLQQQQKDVEQAQLTAVRTLEADKATSLSVDQQQQAQQKADIAAKTRILDMEINQLSVQRENLIATAKAQKVTLDNELFNQQTALENLRADYAQTSGPYSPAAQDIVQAQQTLNQLMLAAQNSPPSKQLSTLESELNNLHLRQAQNPGTTYPYYAQSVQALTQQIAQVKANTPEAVQIEQLKQQIAQMQSNLNDLIKRQEESIARTQASITTLQAELKTLASNQDVTRLSQHIDSLKLNQKQLSASALPSTPAGHSAYGGW